VPAVIHIFDTAPPMSPGPEGLEDFDEDIVGVQVLSEDSDGEGEGMQEEVTAM
jgi:hypothetical protein